MKSVTAQRFDFLRPLPTLGEQVRAEAKRRGGDFARRADHYAALAEREYGRRPLRGEERRIMFDDVFRHG
ncbi:hypothetical protein NOV72_05743 [Caballeronia novacaledonica]|uniref:Uncharacterized protein n=1 Tax=Caballeronia novacaledonica TaxID=1544861 RepID=A0A2U3IEI6_9BURK|nr:hypothetical protein [Caballeronia novacaledonica]SPB18543.1 hypothetical protein NOV72_05743 [Caballeronia novacaledonica]